MVTVPLRGERARLLSKPVAGGSDVTPRRIMRDEALERREVESLRWSSSRGVTSWVEQTVPVANVSTASGKATSPETTRM
jgi:hypothetical protein